MASSPETLVVLDSVRIIGSSLTDDKNTGFINKNGNGIEMVVPPASGSASVVSISGAPLDGQKATSRSNTPG